MIKMSKPEIKKGLGLGIYMRIKIARAWKLVPWKSRK